MLKTATLDEDASSSAVTATNEQPPRWYNNYYNVRLAGADFGKSRKEHYKICNQFLLKQVEKDEAAGVRFCPDISNVDLIALISKNTQNGTHSLHPHFIWEHCSSTTAHGVLGVMRLIPKSQHTPGSLYWRLLHPEYKNMGGYHEWAIPAGAPTQSSIRTPKRMTIDTISALHADELPLYFHKAVDTNNYEALQNLLIRARDINYSSEQLQKIFTESYVGPGIKKSSTLLHRAVKNGHPGILEIVLVNGDTRKQLQSINLNGDTPAHIAARQNRLVVLEKLGEYGAKFAVRNNAGETIQDVAAMHAKNEDNYRSICSRVHKTPPFVSKHSETIPPEKQSTKPLSATARMVRDPAFVYAGLARKEAASPEAKRNISAIQTPPVTKAIFNGFIPKPTVTHAVLPAVSASTATHGRINSAPPKTLRAASMAFWNERKMQPVNQQTYKAPMHPQGQQQVQRPIQQPVRQQVPQQIKQVQPQAGKPVIQLQVQRRVQPQFRQNINKPPVQRQPQLQRQQRMPQQQTQQQAQQQAQQKAQQQAQQRAQQQAQQRAQQQTQQQAQQRAQQQAQQRAQQQAQQRAQQQAQQRAQQQAQQRAQQQTQQQAQQRARQQAQQRAQQQAQQRAQQQAQQRAQQQAQAARQQQAQRAAQQSAQRAQAQRAAPPPYVPRPGRR